MASTNHWLVSTLIQRGESDSYIQSRLEALGLSGEEAAHLIEDSRQSTELNHVKALSSTEFFLLLIEAILLLGVFYWLVQWIW